MATRKRAARKTAARRPKARKRATKRAPRKRAAKKRAPRKRAAKRPKARKRAVKRAPRKRAAKKRAPRKMTAATKRRLRAIKAKRDTTDASMRGVVKRGKLKKLPGRTARGRAQDARRRALPPGRRVSASQRLYTERRENRAD